MSDLNYFWDKLILSHNPTKVFIYEGDNDINSGKSIDVIMEGYKELANKMARYLPNTQLYLISPKPSVARWHLKEKYEQLNYTAALWALWEPNINFVDVWTPMCDDRGEVMKDLFIGDNLHMNTKGYEIWASVVKPFIVE
jgi:lysophospholipase L1-like esterase